MSNVTDPAAAAAAAAAAQAQRNALKPGVDPQQISTQYGQGVYQIVQADVSDLKSIRQALREPPDKPDLEAAVGASATAGLVAFKILCNSAMEWHMPATPYEVFVLIAVVVVAYLALAKYLRAFTLAYRPKGLTADALRHLNGMIGQVENPDPDPTPWWARLGAWLVAPDTLRLLATVACVLACCVVAYLKPQAGLPTAILGSALVLGLSAPRIIDRLKAKP